MNEDWDFALDGVASEALERAGIDESPVDAFLLADRLRISVAVDESQPVRGRLKSLDGSPTAFLRPDDRPERLQWALAHEIGESLAWRVAERVDDVATVSPGLREEIANRLASRLLLPTDWFFSDANACGDDLRILKARYATASFALIALRLLDRVSTPAIVTIVDQGVISCRKSNFAAKPPAPFVIEQQAMTLSHESGKAVVRANADFCVRSWPIHESHWKREIAVTTFSIDMAELPVAGMPA